MINEAVHDALGNAVKDGLKFVDSYIESGKYVGNYSNYPSMSMLDTGLPIFSEVFISEGPTKYSSIQAPEIRDIRSENFLPSFKVYIDLAYQTPELKLLYRIDYAGQASEEQEDTEKEWIKEFPNLLINVSIMSLVDRYIYRYKTKVWDQSNFNELYELWENATFGKILNFDIIVPIIAVKCDIDFEKLSDEAGIIRISDKLQLARSMGLNSFYSANKLVSGAATHGLILQNWTVENADPLIRDAFLFTAEAFSKPLNIIDQFFGAFRAVTGAKVGYSQIVVVPKDWGDNWTADLPDIHSFTVRSYPDEFEARNWDRVPYVLDASIVKKIQQVFNGILDSKSNSLALATRRLNWAFLRKNDEDAILDITIALEALLVADGSAEMTHKLSMRLAGICSIYPYPNYKPQQIFELCKKIYGYRSAVAHGEHNTDKKRVISYPEEHNRIEVVRLASDLLRHCIQFLCQKPEYLKPAAIDSHLLNTKTEADETVDPGTPEAASIPGALDNPS